MRRPVALIAVIVASLFAGVTARSQGEAPRLLVVVVVDQMRADYLTVLQRHWRSGFRTLLSEGAVFDRAEYPYLNTWTCTGHATISTGALPRTHGIIGNDWWDRDAGKVVDCSIDERPASAHVSYGEPAKSGNSAHLILTPTLGDELRSQRPESRLVSLSLKPDSAIGLAGQGGDVVAWFDDEARSFVTSRAFTDTPKRVLADFLSRDPFQADLGRSWTLLLPENAYLFPDATLGQRPPAGRDGLFPHAISGPDGPNERSILLWRQSPFSDRYLARMAEAMVAALELGRDDVPDVLTVSFSGLDHVGHAFGPESREVEDVLVNLDRTLGGLVAVLDRDVGRERYVLALTADHGVAPTPQYGAGGRVIQQDVRERVEETLRAHWGTREDADYVASVRLSSIYFAPGVYTRLRADRPAWQAVRTALAAIPGIAAIVASDELSASSPDPFNRAAALSYVPGRSGDITLNLQRHWIWDTRGGPNATTHGGQQEYDRRVPLILFGAGVKAGRFTQNATPADIAPTLADRIGLPLPRAEGRVLREALTGPDLSRTVVQN